jgi:hypothetical protein
MDCRGAKRKTALRAFRPAMTKKKLLQTSERTGRMHSETPLAFHRRRVEALSNTLGAWLECGNASCRRAGACRRATDVYPMCLPAVVREMSTSIDVCTAAIPGRTPRVETEEETMSAQIQRLNKRLANILEAQVEEFERKRARRAERRAG